MLDDSRLYTVWYEDVVQQIIEQTDSYPTPIIKWRWIGYDSNRKPDVYHIGYQLDKVCLSQYPDYMINVYSILCEEYIKLGDYYGLTNSGIRIFNDDFTDHLCVIRDITLRKQSVVT